MAIDKKIASTIHTLDKCNPRMSGNLKFVCDDDDIYIDSINSTPELSRSVYKSYKVNTNNNLMANAKNFFNLFTTKDDIFEVKDDKNYIVSDYNSQHDRIYNYGAYSDVSELIKKRFRFFAPIHINEEAKKPDLFLVYRIDRNSFNDNTGDWNKELLFSHDFRTSSMGEQLDRHISYLKNYEYDMGIFSNYGDNLSYTGTSIHSGLMQSQYEDDFDSLFANERTITEFNNYVVDGFKRNGLIDTRYLNLEFCFDIDLQDIDLNDKFVDVVGVYVNLEELKNVNEYNISDYDFKLLENNGVIKKHEGVLSEDDLEDNFVKVGEHLGVQYTSSGFLGDFPPLVMIRPNFIPDEGDRIILSYEGNAEITYHIKDTDIVSNDIMATAQNVSKSLTEFARTNVSNLFIDSYIHDGEFLVIRSLLDDETFNKITVDLLPPQYSIVEPSFILDKEYQNTFYSPSDSSTITTFPIASSVTGSDKLRLGDTIEPITFIGRWLSYYFYNTENSLKTENSDPELFESIKTETSKIYQCKIIEHRKFDFDRETSYHEDVFDFELDAYRLWLLSEINSDNFLGKYEYADEPTPTDSELIAYKLRMVDIVERYFSSISINRNMLLKDIDTDDFQGTSVKNEFDRLGENDNINLLKTNMTVQHINKFMFANGLDVYNRPYNLNVGLPFRYSNFAPSLNNINRDLRDNTHSWLVIGEGLPPYFQTLEIDGDPLIKQVEVETEQIVNTIERFYGNIGEDSELSEWVFNSARIDSGETISTGVITFLNSLGYVTRNIDILPDTISGNNKMNYLFKIDSPNNANLNIKIDFINSVTLEVYRSWEINRNVVGGEVMTIDEVVDFTMPLNSENVSIKISMPVGWATPVEIIDLNFYKGTMLQNTLDESINLDSDDIQGTLKYASDIISGYTTIPLSVADIQSTTSDVFNFVRSHSKIRLEDGEATCFFRGLKCVFNTKYDGWKFAAVLITKTAPIGEDRSIKLYENNTFKSLVLVVNMYIPEPVLTSLEKPYGYWLDRSLLYFSDGNYATDDRLQSFGLEELSVRINDVGTPKTYLGNVVTNDWYYQTNNTNFIHVNKGILTRFNVDFTTMLNLGEDFQAFFANTDDSQTTNYGMLITFKEIQEVKEGYFWCKEITVRIKEVNGGVTDIVEYNMLETFLANNNAFLDENRMDIVEAILLENAKYDRVIKNTSAIARYSLLSTASIFDWLNSNKVEVNVEDGSSHFDNMTAFAPTVNEGVISYYEDDKDIKVLPIKYTNTFVRQNGAYNPITKLLRKSTGEFKIDYVDYGYSNKASNNVLLTSTPTNLDRSNGAVWFYRNDFSNTDLSKHYRYYQNRLDYDVIPWYANPSEYKHEVSTILSSSDEIKLSLVYDGEVIDIYSLLKTYLLRILENTGYKSSDYDVYEKIEMIKLSNVGVDEKTFDQYDFEDIILRRFYKSVFSEIYNVVSVKNIDSGDTLIDFYETSEYSIELNGTNVIGSNLEIMLDRI